MEIYFSNVPNKCQVILQLSPGTDELKVENGICLEEIAIVLQQVWNQKLILQYFKLLLFSLLWRLIAHLSRIRRLSTWRLFFDSKDLDFKYLVCAPNNESRRIVSPAGPFLNSPLWNTYRLTLGSLIFFWNKNFE